MEKRIELAKIKVSDIKTDFGNPRKISKKKFEELKKSMQDYGDFGIFVVDDKNNVISGNQRLAVIREMDPEAEVTCKRLIGYTKAELRAINIKANVHAGEWDLDMLADWTADLNIDLGIDLDEQDVNEREIPEMEPIRYEKYDYVMIVCRSELDYNDLVRKLGIEGKKIKVCNTRKIKARAVWYDKMKAKIVPIDDKSEKSGGNE